jgi:hypothetical protein
VDDEPPVRAPRAAGGVPAPPRRPGARRGAQGRHRGADRRHARHLPPGGADAGVAGAQGRRTRGRGHRHRRGRRPLPVLPSAQAGGPLRPGSGRARSGRRDAPAGDRKDRELARAQGPLRGRPELPHDAGSRAADEGEASARVAGRACDPRRLRPARPRAPRARPDARGTFLLRGPRETSAWLRQLARRAVRGRHRRGGA